MHLHVLRLHSALQLRNLSPDKAEFLGAAWWSRMTQLQLGAIKAGTFS